MGLIRSRKAEGPAVATEGVANAGPGRASVRSSASRNFATQVSVAVLALVNVIIVSRGLGPTGRGDVVFLTTICFLSAQLATLSVGESLANLAGQSPEHRGGLATNATVLAVLLGVVAAGVLAVLMATVPALAPDVSWSLKLLALAAIPFLILQSYFTQLVLADYGFRVINASWLIPAVATLTVNGALSALGRLTVGSAFSVWVAGQMAGLALLSWYIARHLAGFGRANRALGREMVAFGLKAHGSRTLMWGNYRLDQWIVGAIAGSRELGLYSVAVAWSEGLFLVPQALSFALRPDLIRHERREAGAHAAVAFRIAAIFSVILGVIVIVAAPFLCVTVFGSSFHGSIADLRVLALGATGIAALKMFGAALISQRKPLLETIATATAFGAMLGLDLVLVPSLGGLGAAIASTVAYSAGGLAVAIIAARTLSIAWRSFVPSRSDFKTLHAAAVGILRFGQRRRRTHVPEGGSG
jgi:O-antigen/teichoic acid export membrane protein